jgi:CHAT domain-containing protein
MKSSLVSRLTNQPNGSGQRQPITILPSVASLRALQTAKTSEATEPFIGFGNPLLIGTDGKDTSAFEKQSCPKAPEPKPARIASIAASIASLFRGGTLDVEELRRQPPLPETADELCAVAQTMGVAPPIDKAVYLGERDTVSLLKDLSKTGALARARVVHFATHGLLANETALFGKTKAEPALVFTRRPPRRRATRITGFSPPRKSRN